MMVSGSDEGASGEDAVAVGGFFDCDGAVFVQAVGESAGEHLGHVLDDDDAGASGRHGLQEYTKGFGAAGGSADGDNFVSRGRELLSGAECEDDVGSIPRGHGQWRSG